MRKFDSFNSHVAVIDIFSNLCINIFPSPIYSPHQSDFLSILDDEHRQIFFHAVLLMEHHNLFVYSPPWIQEAHIPELVISHLESISVPNLNHLVALLLSILESCFPVTRIYSATFPADSSSTSASICRLSPPKTFSIGCG